METAAQEYIVHATDTPEQFPSGRRVLVEVDPLTNAIRFIREL
jgi:hypothetical protein